MTEFEERVVRMEAETKGWRDLTQEYRENSLLRLDKIDKNIHGFRSDLQVVIGAMKDLPCKSREVATEMTEKERAEDKRVIFLNIYAIYGFLVTVATAVIVEFIFRKKS